MISNNLSKRNKEECNHSSPEKEGSTLVRLPKLKMISPKQVDCYCSICRTIIRYIVDENGNFVVK